MSDEDWLEVGALLEEIATFRGGPKNVYKPVVRLEWYEHDDIAIVHVGRCKDMGELVVSFQAHGTAQDFALVLALREALRSLRHG